MPAAPKHGVANATFTRGTDAVGPFWDCKVRVPGHKALTKRERGGTKANPPQRLKAWAIETRDKLLGVTVDATGTSVAAAVKAFWKDVWTKKEKQRNEAKVRQHLDWWAHEDRLGTLPVADVTPLIIGRLLKQLSEAPTRGRPGHNPRTVNAYLTSLKMLFAAFSNAGRPERYWLRSGNPAAQIDRYETKEYVGRALDPIKELPRVLLAVTKGPKRMEWMVRVACVVGARAGQMLKLQWSAVDLTKGEERVTWVFTKNGEDVTAPLLGDALVAFHEMRRHHLALRAKGIITPYVFTDSDGQPYSSNSAYETAWTGLVTRAKAGHFRMHDLRYTAVTRLLGYGMEIHEVQKIVGHKTVAMALKYNRGVSHEIRRKMATALNLEAERRLEYEQQQSV